jgi:hypothetical protein
VSEPFVSATGISYPRGYEFPIASLAQHVLATIVATYAERAEFATTLPARQLVAIGTVAVDSPLLAVMFGGVAVGPPGNELTVPMRDNDPRTAQMNVELWRPIRTSLPSGLPASATAVSADSEVTMQDAWLLLESAYACDQLGVGVIASVAVNEPEGELVGVSMSLSLQVP